MPIVFAAIGSGATEAVPGREVCKHAAHVFKPRRLRLQSKKIEQKWKRIKIPAHENPAQPIVPETSATVQPGQQLVPGQPNAQSASEQPATTPEQSVPEPQPDHPAPAGQLYDPNEAAQIVLHLTDGYFDPEYILLFGKLVGGTPHSDAMGLRPIDGRARNTRIRLDSGQTHPAVPHALPPPQDHLHQSLYPAAELCRIELDAVPLLRPQRG